jgi:homopolymeric O-antigen transport system ATP-binding protein
MGRLVGRGLGKAYKQYPSRWSRLAEWVVPGGSPRHRLHWVLRDVSFEVAAGEAVGIVGVNGAGKSTLLKLVCGTTQSTTGSVEVEGRVSALLELGMGFHPDFTGRQNAYMAGQLLGMTLAEVQAAMPEIEAFAEIGEYIDEPVRIYSSGMQVRLAFSVATVRRPDVLIVDEALSVGDAYFQRKSFGRIRELQKSGTTLLLVSHDMGALRAFCNRAIWLDAGQVRAEGDTREVVDRYVASVYSKGGQDIALPDRGREDRRDASPVDVPRLRDLRQDFVNASNLRNDIRVGRFDREAARWGQGSARIRDVGLRDLQGRGLSWVVGGEPVRVVIAFEALADLESVFAGFDVKDRLGQPLFGDNSFLRYLDNPVSMRRGEVFEAVFEFVMPVLAKGPYALTAAVATGTQEAHAIEEWIDAAANFESYNQSPVQGLIGIPLKNIHVGPAQAG